MRYEVTNLNFIVINWHIFYNSLDMAQYDHREFWPIAHTTRKKGFSWAEKIGKLNNFLTSHCSPDGCLYNSTPSLTCNLLIMFQFSIWQWWLLSTFQQWRKRQKLFQLMRDTYSSNEWRNTKRTWRRRRRGFFKNIIRKIGCMNDIHIRRNTHVFYCSYGWRMEYYKKIFRR